MKSRAIIIERDAGYARELKGILREEGFAPEILFSATGMDILLLIREYNVIFLDIDIWKKTAFFLTRAMKDISGSTRLILTSREKDNNSVLKDAMLHGVYGCVFKPFIRGEVDGVLEGVRPPNGEKLRIFTHFLISVFTALALVIMPAAAVSAQTLRGVPDSVRTPQELSEWFGREFTYRFELGDQWQGPQETVDSKEGDCEDFAFLVSAMLGDWGIANDVIIIEFRGLSIKHAICAWKEENGTYSFISNKKLYRSGRRSLKEAVARYYPDMERIYKADLC